MNLPTRTWLVFFLAMLLICADVASARPRWFGRRSSTGNGSSGIKAVAPKVDPASASYRPLRAHFSYNQAMTEEVAFADRIRVFFVVSDEEVLNATEPIVAEAKVTDLSNDSATTVKYCPVSFQPSQNNETVGTFDIMNEAGEPLVVEPAKVYRLFVNLHRESPEYGAESVCGKLSTPYYVATADDTQLGRARRHIAMRTFKEFYFVQQGWASEERYPMDCYAYYTWATGSCTVGAHNGHAILDRLFGHRRPFQGGGVIANLAARREAIHGDYVRMPGHSFMLLAYAPTAGHVWTMEGNFNSSIEIVIRSVDPGWTVGHLAEEHVAPGMFQVTQAAAHETQPTLN